jgi:hypothetical protein
MKYLKSFVNEFSIRIEYQNLMTVFITLFYIIHVAGCLWYASHFFDVSSNENWITENDLKDESIPIKYVYSIYWATVTCTTVGYGDILPMNGFEMVWAMLIIVFGVAVFSYILSDMSSKFSEIYKNKSANVERIK